MTGYIESMPDGGTRNYGFIKGENEDQYFFHRDNFNGHWNDLVRDFNVREGPIIVSFDTVSSEKGLRAANVRRLDYPNEAA